MKSKEIKILQNGDPLLRQISKTVDVEEIKDGHIKDIVSDLISAMSTQDDAIAISAIQIGIPKRIFVISKKIHSILGKDDNTKGKSDLIFINPKITKISKEKCIAEEGCLSVRYIYGKVKRAKKISLEAYDIKGKKFTMGASGLLAQIIQHENDHLDGILFIDKATDLQEIRPEDIKNI